MLLQKKLKKLKNQKVKNKWNEWLNVLGLYIVKLLRIQNLNLKEEEKEKLNLLSLIDDIKAHEGFRSKPYRCTEGYLTIAYGQRLDYIEVDEETGTKWLMKRINDIIKDLDLRFPWYSKAPKEVQDIVVNMSYQMGISGFAQFKQTIKYLEQGLYYKASNEMLDSLWSKQTPERSKELSDKLKQLGDR